MIVNDILLKYQSLDTIIIYNELFGGIYSNITSLFSSFEKAIDYKIGFNTHIPLKFNLLLNKAEGVVIRSMTDRYTVKRKISEFSETKYSDNSLNNHDKLSIGMLMITENRLNNAISKFGSFEDNKYLIYDLSVSDILNELNIKEKTWTLFYGKN